MLIFLYYWLLEISIELVTESYTIGYNYCDTSIQMCIDDIKLLDMSPVRFKIATDLLIIVKIKL